MLVFTKCLCKRHIVKIMNTLRKQWSLSKDLQVFLTVIRQQSFAAAALELGVSPAYVSKRIRLLEEALDARLFHRTGRRCSLTAGGELVERGAGQILDDMDSLFDDLSTTRQSPHGLLHICSSFGFGRNHVAPAVAMLAEQFPDLEIRFDVFDRVVDIDGEGFDLEIWVGDDLPGQHICRRLVSNQRVLCAAPAYLQRRDTPGTLEELAQHDCLVIKERNNAFGGWNLQRDGQSENVRISGRLSSNNGEIVLQCVARSRRSYWFAGKAPSKGSRPVMFRFDKNSLQASVRKTCALICRRFAVSTSVRMEGLNRSPCDD